jgi:hypothetical protein
MDQYQKSRIQIFKDDLNRVKKLKKWFILIWIIFNNND